MTKTPGTAATAAAATTTTAVAEDVGVKEAEFKEAVATLDDVYANEFFQRLHARGVFPASEQEKQAAYFGAIELERIGWTRPATQAVAETSPHLRAGAKLASLLNAVVATPAAVAAGDAQRVNQYVNDPKIALAAIVFKQAELAELQKAS